MTSFAKRLLLIASLPLAACGAPATPMIPTPSPVPFPTVPVTVAPSSARYTLASNIAAIPYRIATRVILDRDSAGKKDQETLETSARIEIALQRDARGSLRGTARVDSFWVRSGRGADSPLSIAVPVSGTPPRATANASAVTGGQNGVTATLDVRVASVQVDARLDSAVSIAAVRPALPNECDRPEAAAAAMARELLIRVPTNIGVGDRWRDSVASVVCRGGVVMTLRQTIESVAEGVSDGGRTLVVQRQIASVLGGSSTLPWRQTDVSGDGRGTQTVRVDIASGAVNTVTGESTLTLTVTQGSARGSAVSQRITQRTALTIQR